MRGDLHESWEGERLTRRRRWRSEVKHLSDVIRTLGHWWTPSAVRRRAQLGMDIQEVREARTGEGVGMGDLISTAMRILRGLMRRPGFTTVTVATMALGVGATTTILSVVDGVMLRPLPYEDGERVVAVGVTFPDREWVEGASNLQRLAGVSVPNFEYVRSRARSFEGLGAAELASVLLADQGEGPLLLRMARVSEDFFEVLRTDVHVGRLFAPDEYGPNDVQPIVLSHRTWINRFGGDPSIIGSDLSTATGPGSTTPVIIGVLSADFVAPESSGLGEVEFWQPLDAGHARYSDRGRRAVTLLGRLADGATVEAARIEVDALGAEIAREFPEGSVYPDGSRFGYGVNSLRLELVGTTRRPLMVFLGAAALLLLISSMNTASLLLARSNDRTGELSIRQALGAGRRVIVGEVMLESLLLAVAGGALGIVVALVGVELFLSLSPSLPRMESIGVDGRILTGTLILSIGVGVAMGIVPSLSAGRKPPSQALRAMGTGAAGRTGRLRSVLVSAQLGLALVLGIGASVLTHSFVKVASVDPGFEAEGLTSFSLATKRPGAPEATWAAWDQTLDAVRGVQGLRSVAGTSNLPFEDPNWAPGFRFPGETDLEVRVGLAGYAVTPRYFETIGQQILEGRGVLTTDGPDAAPVAIVNRALVDRDFEGQEALGATILIGPDQVAHQIIGVVENAIVRRAEEGPRPALYLPYTQVEWPTIKVVLRSDREFGPLSADLRTAAATISPIVPIQSMIRLEDRIRGVETEPRFQALLIVAFALTALLLSAVGLYGSLAHSIGRRQRELGIRLALGAAPRRVFWMVLRQGVSVTASGAAAGLAGAVIMSRVLERFLYEVPALDPVAFAVGLGALAIAALAAVAAPARRAARVDVVSSIRAE